MFKKKEIVNAILDSDLDNLLKQTEQYEALLKGEILCKSCGIPISIGNIGVIIPKKEGDKILLEFYCDDQMCIKKLNEDGRI